MQQVKRLVVMNRVKVCNSMAELEAYIKEQLQDCLYNEIGDEIEHSIQRHIESDVYGAYSPKVYKRRGLLKSGRYFYRVPNGLSITVYDQTPGSEPSGNGYTPTGTSLSEIINFGLQGHGGGKWKKAFPRPYIKNAQEEIDRLVPEIIKRRFG